MTSNGRPWFDDASSHWTIRPGSPPVPSPPSAGERARVRGPSASRCYHSAALARSRSNFKQDAARGIPPLTPTLSPADGGEGVALCRAPVTGAVTP